MATVVVEIRHIRTATLRRSRNPAEIQPDDWNDLHLIDPVAFSTAINIHVVTGNPNGVLTAPQGDLARDTVSSQLWMNTSGGSVWTAFVRADGGAAVPRTAFAALGDSNTAAVVGIGTDEIEFGTSVPDPGITYNGYYALASSDPPTFVNMGTGPLRPHVDSSITYAGYHLEFSKMVIAAGIDAWSTMMAISGTSLAEWVPSSTYMLATTGTNLYNTWKARQAALLATSGRALGGVVIGLFTNDAATSLNANQVTARLAALTSQIRSDFGSGVAFVFILPHVSTGNAFISTARAQVIAAGLAIPNVAVVNVDAVPLAGDLLHYTRPTLVGQLTGIAMLDLLGYKRRTFAVPDIVGWAPASFGSGAMTPSAPADIRHGDLLLMAVVTGVTSGTLSASAPSGWTREAFADTVSVSGVFEHFALFSKPVLQSELDVNGKTIAPVSIAAVGVENAAQIFCVRSAKLFPTVVAAQATVDGSGGFGTGPLSVTGVTPTAPGQRILVFAGGFAGGIGAGMNATNAGVPDLAKFKDQQYLMPDTGNQLITVFRGTASVATGAFALTTLTGMVKGAIVVALKTP
jgi:hypothetical protein